MRDIMRVTGSGNLTPEAQVRETTSGAQVAVLAIAFTTRRPDGHGAWADKASYLDVAVWGGQARNCAEHLGKGSRVFIDSELDYQEWEERASGQKRRTTCVALGHRVRPAADGVTRTKALGTERMARKLRDALPGEDSPLNSTVWEFMRPMLSPTLVEVNRDTFMADDDIRSTVELNGPPRNVRPPGPRPRRRRALSVGRPGSPTRCARVGNPFVGPLFLCSDQNILSLKRAKRFVPSRATASGSELGRAGRERPRRRHGRARFPAETVGN